MKRKLSTLSNNIFWVVIAVIVVAITAATLFYWAPWRYATDKAVTTKMAERDANMIVIACKNEPPGLNPYSATAQAATQLSNVFYSGLTSFNEKGDATPELAVAVPTLESGLVSPDGKSVTYKLHDGVKWSDGQPFTAADVVATWRYIMTSKKVAHRDGYERIEAIDTPDSLTVTIKFRQYYPEFLTLFETILPAHILAVEPEKLERNPVGTGPYKLKEWLLGDCLMLEANDDYYRGKPKIANVKVRFISEAKLLLAQLKSGELDLATDVDLQQLDLVRGIKNYEVKFEPSLELTRLDFNCNDELLQSNKIRKALAVTVDKKHICDGLLSGAALQASNYVAPFSRYNNAGIVEKRDMQGARSVLASEGWIAGQDGLLVKAAKKMRVELLVDGDSSLRTVVAENIVAGFRDVGIDAVLTKVNAAEFANRIRSGKYQIALYAELMYPGFYPYLFWSSQMIPAAVNGYAGMNFPRLKNEQVEKNLASFTTPLSDNGYKDGMLLLQDCLNKETPCLPIYYRQTVDVVRKGLKNYAPGVTAGGKYGNSHLWQW